MADSSLGKPNVEGQQHTVLNLDPVFGGSYFKCTVLGTKLRRADCAGRCVGSLGSLERRRACMGCEIGEAHAHGEEHPLGVSCPTPVTPGGVRAPAVLTTASPGQVADLRYRAHREKAEKDAPHRVIRNPQKTVVMIQHAGRTQSVRAWAMELGVHHSTILNRHKAGHDISQPAPKPVKAAKKSVSLVDIFQGDYRIEPASLDELVKELRMVCVSMGYHLNESWVGATHIMQAEVAK
jgi:hypothetical protein